jgi:hypothetical protein
VAVVVAAVIAVVGSVLSLVGAPAAPPAPTASADLRVLPTASPEPVPETPSPAPAAVVAEPAAPTSAARATGARATGPAPRPRPAVDLPAQIIDPRNWYLTLPTGNDGDPDTVSAAQLATYRSEYYTLNDSRDGVVFTADAGGVTTANSKYPRSELREMNGDEKASWDGGSGTHTMELVQAITKTPSAKPDVIAGQIHDGADDVMQIHLSGNRLTVKYADGKKEVLLEGDYRLGTRFRVKIESSGGHVKVWYDGALAADLPISSSSSYFKAGAYVNSNTDQGEAASAVGQVVIYGLQVTHS